MIMQDQENKDFHKLAGLQGVDGEEPAKVLQTYTVPSRKCGRIWKRGGRP